MSLTKMAAGVNLSPENPQSTCHPPSCRQISSTLIASRDYRHDLSGNGSRQAAPSATFSVNMPGQVIFYQFSRSKVERGDFSHFLGLYGPEKLPVGRRLREMMDGMVFGIDGWPEDPREIHMIPEIRRFYAAFHEAWPYWLYFCNLEMDTLRAMTMCCLPSVNTMQREGQFRVAVTCDPLDLLKFLKRDFMPMNLMCEQAGMFEERIYNRTKALFHFFGLPFDAEPPIPKCFG
jgi:hypothetical protein